MTERGTFFSAEAARKPGKPKDVENVSCTAQVSSSSPRFDKVRK